MNLQNIFSEIQAVDPEFHERISPRREAIRNMTGFGKKLALSALPLAMGSLFTKAYGQNQPTAINDILNFALTLEYLEEEFYTKGVAAHTAIPAPAIGALTAIRNDEKAHVTFLKSQLGANAVPKPTFDFTAKGAFADPFIVANYGVFLALAQAFEDTGVRAYKGQAPFLIGNKTVLGAALNIHSVEARHASHIRQMRKARNDDPTVKPWITGKDRGTIPAAAQAVYDGEELENKVGTSNLTGMTVNEVTLSQAAVTEAFDEPLTFAQANTIAKLFIV